MSDVMRVLAFLIVCGALLVFLPAVWRDVASWEDHEEDMRDES